MAPKMEKEKCQVTYSHRGSLGNIKTIPFDFIERLEGGFIVMVDGGMVPYHRIIKIECEGNIIWKKGHRTGDLDD